MNRAIAARIAQAAARAGLHRRQADVAAELDRVRSLTPQEAAREYRERLRAIETEAPDLELAGQSALELVDRYRRTIGR